MQGKHVETMPISEFKATCLSVLERVRRTGTPIVITRRGEPIAEVVPPSNASAGAGWLGIMRGTAVIAADLVAPTGPVTDWEALGS
jgi:prevent-host-death family protein